MEKTLVRQDSLDRIFSLLPDEMQPALENYYKKLSGVENEFIGDN